jgi:ankyrin repeat protein
LLERELNRLADVLHLRGVSEFAEELKNCENLSKSDLNQLLIFLAPLGATKWPQLLFEMGADLNTVDDEGQTPLSCCVHGAVADKWNKGRSTFATACELVTLGSDPNSAYMHMASVTALAIRLGQKDLATLFLLAGADPDRQEPDSLTTETLRDVILASELDWPRQVLAMRDMLVAESRKGT